MLLTGFTPVIDEINADVGLYAAFLYGYIWRKSQLSRDKNFDEPVERICKTNNLGRTTVTKYLAVLVGNKYLSDETPDIKNKPHTYTPLVDITPEISLKRYPRGEQQHYPRDEQHYPRDEHPLTARRIDGYPRGGHTMSHDDDNIHEDMQDVIHTALNTLGLDVNAVDALVKSNDIESVAKLLHCWEEAELNGDIPETWGAGLLFNKIRDGELPPEREPTIGEEVRALMEQQIRTSVEDVTQDNVGEQFKNFDDPGLRKMAGDVERMFKAG